MKDKKIYYHAIGTAQSADRLIYERKEAPTLFIDGVVHVGGYDAESLLEALGR